MQLTSSRFAQYLSIYEFLPSHLINIKKFYRVSHLNNSLFNEAPNVIHSYNYLNHQNLYNKSSKNELKSMFSLQESLVIFYTSNLIEVETFIDFLVPQLSVRQRPKCLVVKFCNFEDIKETEINHILKYAWRNKFLDFSIILATVTKNVVDFKALVYNYNIFNSMVYENHLTEISQMFPNKLKNAYRYPFYIPNFFTNENFHSTRQQNKKKEYIPTYVFEIIFTATIFNLNVIQKNLSNTQFMDKNYLENNNLEMYVYTFIISNFLSRYVLPLDRPFRNIIAVVPILRFPRIKLSSVTLYTFITIPRLIFTLMFCLKYFKIKIDWIRVWNIFMLILGQSIRRKPKRLTHRIILLTIVIASIKITNDFLLDILVIQFDHDETYAEPVLLKLQDIDDHCLRKIVDNTLKSNSEYDCFESVYKSNNVSYMKARFQL